jgi:flagellin
MANADLTRIAGNIGALNALNSLQNINKQLSLHQALLASGKQINSAADDPAGLSIATKMLARSEGLKTALNNIGDAQNMLSVAEDGMSKINDILVSMRSKAEQAASDTLGTTERQAIQTQLSAFAAQIDDIVSQTKWNSSQLLNGTVNKVFQTGADPNETISWVMGQSMNAQTLGASSASDRGIGATQGGTAVVGDAVLSGSNFTGLSELQTGSYQFSVQNSAPNTANTGKLVSSGTFGVSGSSASAQLDETTEGADATYMRNGNNTLHITSYAYDSGSGNGTLTATLNGHAISVANFTASGLTQALGSTGLNLTIGDVAQGFTAGQDVSFNYVKSGMAQVQLQYADGTAINVSDDGTDASGVASSFYVRAGTGIYDTGTGVSFDAGLLADLADNESEVRTFTYTRENANSVDVSTAENAANYMSMVNTAINTVSSALADLGSLMARLNYKSDQTQTAQVNVEAAYNRIMNADMAAEQVQASKYAILQQTATSMLAQANTAPQSLLTLFR